MKKISHLILRVQTCLMPMRHIRWKNILFALAAVMLVAALSGCVGGGGCCSNSSSTEAKEAATGKAADGSYYTCPMHPEVVQDHPGNCPKCGMTLVVKK